MENQQIRLLKSSKRTPDGKRFDNLYLQVGDGKYAPIAIQLVRFNPKQKNLLLALATPCEIKRVTLVANLDKPQEVQITEEGKAE